MGETYSWASPEVVGRMTMAQVNMYMAGDKKQGRRMSKKQIDEFADKVRKKHGVD